jgi:hypothetical protein
MRDVGFIRCALNRERGCEEWVDCLRGDGLNELSCAMFRFQNLLTRIVQKLFVFQNLNDQRTCLEQDFAVN